MDKPKISYEEFIKKNPQAKGTTKEKFESYSDAFERLLEDLTEDPDLLSFATDFAKAQATTEGTKVEDEFKKVMAILGALKIAKYKLIKIKL